MKAGVGFDGFKVQLSRFTDRGINGVIGKQKRSFFNRAGGAIRKTARQSLRRAPQKKTHELTPRERVRYEARLAEFRRGEIRSKPRRPDKTATRGSRPLLHMRESHLRELLYFYTSEDKASVLIGPASFKGGDLRLLEQNFPFMAPALVAIEPRFPEFLAAAKTA